MSAARLQGFGRAALRAVTALDAGPDLPAVARPDLVAQRQVLPAWGMRMLVGILLLAPALATVDAVARARRRGEPITRWVAWTLASALPFLLAAVAARLLGLSGLLPAAPATPVDPGAVPGQGPALLAVLLVLALGWAAARPLVLRALGADRGDPAAPGAAAGVLLVLQAAAIALWIVNPYAAALLVPAAHLWLFALVPEFRPSRGVGLVLAVVALGPLIAVVAWGATAFASSPVEALWFSVLLLAGGHASPAAWLVWSAVAGAAAGAFAIAWRGRARAGDESVEITVRGPLGYAGPGSLGGVESALRR